MKKYIPKDAICDALQFDGSNKDEFVKNFPIDRDNVQIWRSDDGDCKMVVQQTNRNPELCDEIRPKDWIVKDKTDTLKCVSDKNFQAWYQEI